MLIKTTSWLMLVPTGIHRKCTYWMFAKWVLFLLSCSIIYRLKKIISTKFFLSQYRNIQLPLYQQSVTQTKIVHLIEHAEMNVVLIHASIQIHVVEVLSAMLKIINRSVNAQVLTRAAHSSNVFHVSWIIHLNWKQMYHLFWNKILNNNNDK